MNDFQKLVRYCIKIDEFGWSKDLLSISSSSTIEDFNDLECHLIDNNLMDFEATLIKKVKEAVQE